MAPRLLPFAQDLSILTPFRQKELNLNLEKTNFRRHWFSAAA